MVSMAKRSAHVPVSPAVAALERGLRHDPDDWTQWLIFADQLAEQGDPRGDAIALAHRVHSGPPQERAALERELNELLGKHRRKWAVRKMPKGHTFTWKHGFIIGATLPLEESTVAPLDTLLTHPSARVLGELRLCAPSVDEDDIDFDDDEDEPEETAPPLSTAAIERILDLALPPLRTLAIVYGPLLEESTRAIAKCDALRSLHELDLRFTSLGDEGANLLAQSKTLGTVRALRLQSNELGPNGVRAIVDGFPQLEELDLRGNRLGEDGARALADAPTLKGLQRLFLDVSDVGRDGAAMLSQSKCLSSKIRRLWAAHRGVYETELQP